MKKNITLFIIFLIIAFTAIKLQQGNKNTEYISPASNKNNIQITPQTKFLKEEKFLFVPYWSFDKEKIESREFENLIYFGISANKNGIDKNDTGYKKITAFRQLSDDKKKFLTLRMLDSDINFSILKNKDLQKKIINQSIDITKNNTFDGLLLDLEISALPFESIVKEVTDFMELFNKSAKNKNLLFYVALYGDTFYRLRPYDVQSIEKHTDKIMIMAYDFHKAKGDPGPNFQLEGKERYGYDFKNMIDDFLKTVPGNKLSIVFGLYGYDWPVDEKERSKAVAQILSLNEIKFKFLDKCNLKDCIVTRDKQSSESKIVYVDEEGISHNVWFEDEISIKEKQKYLLTKGMGSIAYWAYSYFDSIGQ
ncbi:MAG: hypothetical protein A2857_04370 [Candidatus Levybacteria bacterium RIFCSPHIGHO2_01_FULL_36_15]|nr:MAG: hypothetical protein A2857_04370 [Candidatus Levybacteria bacterium RIFCSPHIGHO2_01_FULL_36_15]OGH37602.1 MAG: hypothetical protein A2905_04985 [Candidatus Levybacteria bacterium RIFCSPLOWO2_01_FULL_36_10]